jgi:peptidoglycan/LPS O-acetylase OafA/YrhL
MAKPAQLLSLTSLRFFAALWVLLFHVIPLWWPEGEVRSPLLFQILRCGFISVPFFYALSGFVLFHQYSRTELAAGKGTGSFLRKRFARIAPVFYLSLLLGAPACFMMLSREMGMGAGLLKLAEFLAVNFLFLGAWWPRSLALNYPAWSISVEFFFYLVFPLCVLFANRLSGRVALMGTALCVVVPAALHGALYVKFPELLGWRGLQGSPSDLGPLQAIAESMQINPVAHWPEFFFGVLLARWWQSEREAGTRRGHGDYQLLGALALLCLVVAAGRWIPHLAMNSFLLLPASGLALWGGALRRGRFKKWLEAGPLVLLGEASFSLYILHVPIRDLVMAALNAMHRTPSLTAAALFVPALIALSVMSFLWFETPSRKLLRP